MISCEKTSKRDNHIYSQNRLATITMKIKIPYINRIYLQK